jgi:DNA invertase Pin-like site-specific DNA recombinase
MEVNLTNGRTVTLENCPSGVETKQFLTVPIPKTKEERNRIVCDLKDGGMTQAEVARATNMSQSSVSNIIRQGKNG